MNFHNSPSMLLHNGAVQLFMGLTRVMARGWEDSWGCAMTHRRVEKMALTKSNTSNASLPRPINWEQTIFGGPVYTELKALLTAASRGSSCETPPYPTNRPHPIQSASTHGRWAGQDTVGRERTSSTPFKEGRSKIGKNRLAAY